jgi:hypothetical protein
MLWLDWLFAPDVLMVGNKSAANRANSVTGQVLYCPRTSEKLHDWLLTALADHR